LYKNGGEVPSVVVLIILEELGVFKVDELLLHFEHTDSLWVVQFLSEWNLLQGYLLCVLPHHVLLLISRRVSRWRSPNSSNTVARTSPQWHGLGVLHLVVSEGQDMLNELVLLALILELQS